jgi:hypothetical protein
MAILPPSYIWNKVLGQLRNRVLYYAHYQEYKKNLLTKTGLFWSFPLRIKPTAIFSFVTGLSFTRAFPLVTGLGFIRAFPLVTAL